MVVDSNIDFEGLVDSTEGYSGAEIQLISREAGLNAIARDL